MILTANKKEIYLVTTTPGVDLQSSINISWHSRKKESYLLYKEEAKNDYIKILPKEEYWSLEENHEENSYQLKRYVCKVSLNNLNKDTKYLYKIVSNNYFSEECSFKTANSKETTFITFADLQYSKNLTSINLIKKFKENNPDVCLITCSGDIADEGCLEESHSYLLDNGLFNDNILAFAVGDHEYWGRSKKPYIQFKRPYSYNKLFYNPENGINEYSNSIFYFKYNQILFIFLDCGDSNISSDDNLFTQQYIWLEEILSKEKEYQFILVHMHKSLFGSIEQDKNILEIRKYFTNLFDKYQVDLVISGHDHQYSRTYSLIDNEINSDGTVYLDLGTSGDKRRPCDESIKNSNRYTKYIDLFESKYSLGIKGSIINETLYLEVRNQDYQLVDQLEIKEKNRRRKI